jgi:hypothetical protein
VAFVRFLYFWSQGQGDGHVQSLLAGSALLALGIQMFVAGLLASAIRWNRRLIEETLYRVKDAEARRYELPLRVATNGGRNGAEQAERGRTADVA